MKACFQIAECSLSSAKILIKGPKHPFERAKIAFLKKNDKKVAKKFGGFK